METITTNLFSITLSILAIIIALITIYVTWRIPHLIMINQRYAELLTEYRSIEMGDAIFSIIDFFVHDCVKASEDCKNCQDSKGCMDYNDCKYYRCTDHNKIDDGLQNLIKCKYRKRYEKEIKEKLSRYRNKEYQKCNGENHTDKDEYDPKNTLHFKRRLVDQFFWLLADLMYNPSYPVHLPTEQVRRDFSKNERYLLHILYHMNKASRLDPCWLDPSPIDKCRCGCSYSHNSPMDKYREKLYKESNHWYK